MRTTRPAVLSRYPAYVYVGIDLGWTTGRTGLAALDERGAFVDSATVTTDDEIVSWIGSLSEPVVVAAVDAPLIVTNPTGQRAAERAITAAFGRFKAGAHTTNLAKPGMNPPRAAQLADRLGWTKHPRPGSAADPACIEVYPHPAMVSMFGLAERLVYKDKSRFSLAQRQDGFAQLLFHLESIENLALADHPRWNAVKAVVAAAQTRAALNRIEDELDAIVCAQLAWVWQTDPASLKIYGDPNDGYIVAPLPPQTTPAPPSARSRRVANTRLIVNVEPERIDIVRAEIAAIPGVLNVT